METPTEIGITLTGPLADRDSWEASRCPLARTLEIVGARSAFLVLREAFYGATRFEQFVGRVGISEPVAAARLKDLTTEGLLEKVPYREPGQRTRHEYHLTDKGKDLLPVLVAMMNWGDRWGLEGGARVELDHGDCGEPVGVTLTCGAGHQVAPDEVELTLRPRRRAA